MIHLANLTPSSLPNRICLSGRMGVGKDYVAQNLGYAIFGFADPMYAIAKAVLGSYDKSVPGVRAFLQKVGQWGWGKLDDQYPLTLERTIITDMIRSGDWTENYPHWQEFDWTQYGRSLQFWVNILLKRVEQAEPHARIAVTNARFLHELLPLKNAGFAHYLIMAEEDVRLKRLGRNFDEKIDNDTSERLAIDLSATMPHDHIIWNS